MDNNQQNIYSQDNGNMNHAGANITGANGEQIPYTGVVYGQAAAEKSGQPGGLAITSFVFGVLSILSCCIGIGAVFGLIAVILGGISLAKKKGKGLSIAGVITGILGMVFSIVVIVVAIAGADASYEFVNSPEYYEFIEELEQELDY